MIEMTPKAVNKVLEIIGKNNPSADKELVLMRISVLGGGCSGFQYSMAVESRVSLLDKNYDFEGVLNGQQKKLRVVVDQASMLYLDGVRIDYVEALEGAGFKFNNPKVKSTCGCGQSFQAEG